MCVGDGFEGWEDGVHLGRGDQADRVEKFQFLVGWSVPGVDSGTRGLGGHTVWMARSDRVRMASSNLLGVAMVKRDCFCVRR